MNKDLILPDIVKATQIKEDGVLTIHSSYKIVEKDETSYLLKVLSDCEKIADAFDAMTFKWGDIVGEAEMIELLNEQIHRNLIKLYRYYHHHFGLTFDDGDWGDANSEFSESWRRQKAIEGNIALICETVCSWEE